MSDFTEDQLKAMREGTTPGPWEVGGTTVWGHVYVGASNPDMGGLVAEVGSNDALLIASAPALVDALIAEKRAHQETLHLVRSLWLDVHHHGYVGRASILRHLTRILEGDNG